MTMTLQEISDRIEIDDLLTRYATGVDRKDWDLWETCFTDDARIDYTAFGGIAGAFQKRAKPLPIRVLGSEDSSRLPQPLAAAVLSIASRSPLGFMAAP